jgi:hypothetical protein
MTGGPRKMQKVALGRRDGAMVEIFDSDSKEFD